MAEMAQLERFRSYNKWLKEKFGERVYKVIVDAGFIGTVSLIDRATPEPCKGTTLIPTALVGTAAVLSAAATESGSCVDALCGYAGGLTHAANIATRQAKRRIAIEVTDILSSGGS